MSQGVVLDYTPAYCKTMPSDEEEDKASSESESTDSDDSSDSSGSDKEETKEEEGGDEENGEEKAGDGDEKPADEAEAPAEVELSGAQAKVSCLCEGLPKHKKSKKIDPVVALYAMDSETGAIVYKGQTERFT